MSRSKEAGGRYLIKINARMHDGEYPSFLVSHIASEWQGVTAGVLDPELCLRVDAWIEAAGLERPSSDLRQFVYALKRGECLDESLITSYVALDHALAEVSDTESDSTWLELLFVEYERDCGLSDEDYQQRLDELIRADWHALGALTA